MNCSFGFCCLASFSSVNVVKGGPAWIRSAGWTLTLGIWGCFVWQHLHLNSPHIIEEINRWLQHHIQWGVTEWLFLCCYVLDHKTHWWGLIIVLLKRSLKGALKWASPCTMLKVGFHKKVFWTTKNCNSMAGIFKTLNPLSLTCSLSTWYAGMLSEKFSSHPPSQGRLWTWPVSPRPWCRVTVVFKVPCVLSTFPSEPRALRSQVILKLTAGRSE